MNVRTPVTDCTGDQIFGLSQFVKQHATNNIVSYKVNRDVI